MNFTSFHQQYKPVKVFVPLIVTLLVSAMMIEGLLAQRIISPSRVSAAKNPTGESLYFFTHEVGTEGIGGGSIDFSIDLNASAGNDIAIDASHFIRKDVVNGFLSGYVRGGIGSNEVRVSADVGGGGPIGSIVTFPLIIDIEPPGTTSPATVEAIRGIPFTHELDWNYRPGRSIRGSTPISITGNLPPGLRLEQEEEGLAQGLPVNPFLAQFNFALQAVRLIDGRITGTPNQSGQYAVDVVSPSTYGTGSVTSPLTINIVEPVITSAATLGFGNGRPLSAFRYQIKSNLDSPIYSATGLPAGLSVNAQTGVISGSGSGNLPGGTFAVEITAVQGGARASATLTVEVGTEVEVVSEFGGEEGAFTPGLGTTPAPLNQDITFEAPSEIFLNANFEEIPASGEVAWLFDADPENDRMVAHFKAENVGYTINGGGPETNAVIEGNKTKIVKPIEEDVRLEWLWKLHYAVFIESDTQIPAAGDEPPPGSGTGNPSPSIGRHFLDPVEHTDFVAQMDRVANSDAGGFRFATAGYEYTMGEDPQNAVGLAGERYLKRDPSSPRFGSDNLGGVNRPYITANGATIAFWGKLDANDSDTDQVFIALKNDYERPVTNRDNVRPARSMRIGVRANGNFFVEEILPFDVLTNAPNLPGIYRELMNVPVDGSHSWHHWAVVFHRDRTLLYRDAVLIRTVPLNDGRAPGVMIQGEKFFVNHLGQTQQNFPIDRQFTSYDLGRTTDGSTPNFLTGGINRVSMARFAANASQIAEHRLSRSQNSIRALAFVNQDLQSSGYPLFPRLITPEDPTSMALGELTGEQVTTESFNLKSWLRIKWLWNGQVRYRLSAGNGDPNAIPIQFANQAYVRVFDETGETIARTVENTDVPTDVWIDTGRKVEVGAFYRTADNCFTLGDFAAPLGGDLRNFGLPVSKALDSSRSNRTTRVYTIASVAAPTEIPWNYQPTVYRAEIPLGQGFDASNPNAQLVPDLCEGGVLLANESGPDALLPIGSVPEGDTTRWDKLAKKLFPVQPGSFRGDWPDANDPSRKYTIEIVSGYPGDTVPLTTARELPDGRREGTAPDYVTTTILAETGPEFPAAPDAHYRHYIDVNDREERRPPTKLDLDPTDHWHFQQLTYSDSSSDAQLDAPAPGTGFATSGPGRSVLLYSFRPNPDEIADGNLDKENLAVRVVHSEVKTPLLPHDPKLVLGRHGLALDGSEIGLTLVSGEAASPELGSSFVMDFWINDRDINDSEQPVQVVSRGEGASFAVTLDTNTQTITAQYRGMAVTHPLPQGRTPWRHCVVHVYESRFLFTDVTVLDFYLDGVRAEQSVVTGELGEAAMGALRFGAGAPAGGGLQIDQFRLFTNLTATPPDTFLTAVELRMLRENRQLELRSKLPDLAFGFEMDPVNNRFANEGTLQEFGLTIPENSDARVRVGLQEVATRLTSTLDSAGFGGGGFILNSVSNYNARLYDREAEVGAWGPIFPVNHGALFGKNDRKLEVAYYENPYLADETLHPNVAWPYEAVHYNGVTYPEEGPHKHKAIYIASRIGSEGVDQEGRPQEIFDLSEYSDLAVYHQPDRDEPGYNPNEEHAITAASGRAALKVKNMGADIPNNPPLAAFALQNDINETKLNPLDQYTSDPWVLVQVQNLTTGEAEMAAYQVFKTREGNIRFPRPSDADVDKTDGLAYEAAPTPEDRFLTIDPAKAYNFGYAFEYPVFAGDLLIPPYPVNTVIGNIATPDARGGNLEVNGTRRRTLWRDVNGHAWIVSGEGKFFHQFFYPMRSDFYLPEARPGQPVSWLPTEPESGFVGDSESGDPDLDDLPRPVKVTYTTSWRTDYPKLKRGETLTYQGGEYFNETPGANGLPALVAMKAAEIVYDDVQPDMILKDDNVSRYAARVIRPLDRRETPFTIAEMSSAGFTPAAQDKVFIVAERWYFKQLPGSLQRRFYFDSLAEKLVFRGYLNDKESGDADLTSGPDPINILEPNVMTADDRREVDSLSEDVQWKTAIRGIYKQSRQPHLVRRFDENGTVQDPTTAAVAPLDQVLDPENHYFAGVRETPAVTLEAGGLTTEEEDRLKSQEATDRELATFWMEENDDFVRVNDPPAETAQFVHLDSFGVGTALVPGPLLLMAGTDSFYITIAENNRPELNGAPVSLHIIEIIPDRYRGAIKVIEGADAFSEKVTLQHNGEFGANTGDLYYEWWIRDAAPLDVVAKEVRADGTLAGPWQEYIPQERAGLDPRPAHKGLHSIVFEGRPDVTLADKLVLMRYRHFSEFDWNLVPFEVADPKVAWKPGQPAPFQWAGAANSPQLQADGSKRYIPQLVMGWVKRILDRINPYEARYTDFFSNESPATYSSQIQIAGAPFAGKVALNPDKNVIENTGLIELYETVLQRARELSIDNSTNGVSTDAINQALLLAATRLAVLYELLAREAYSDAQDPTITVGTDDGLAGVASFTHAFQNFEASLQHEELALLRGTDFRKSFPVFNRMFWNYAKGLGEAAYNTNYHIYDENTDGFINEDDARALYPQGHGDAWGHFVSAIGMHYELLQHPNFSWKTRSELYALMQNVLEVDFLDEKTFAKLAAGKARTARDIVRGTYRLHYTHDPDGQWQGYTDSADPARAWGVSEWATRAGQGAYFDWAVANTLLPDDATKATPVENPENLDRIERSAAESEIGEIASGLLEIQTALDEANGGVNPLGFDDGAMAFDIYPKSFDGGPIAVKTHFEQIYERAVAAGNNAKATLDFAVRAENKLRRIADDTDALIVESLRQDIDYRNRLIEIFGRPYDGTIGFGKVYPEGYEGPDILLYAYLDRTRIDQIIPPNDNGGTEHLDFVDFQTRILGLADSGKTLQKTYAQVYGGGTGNEELQTSLNAFIRGNKYANPTVNFSMPIERASGYAFQADTAQWGQRTSYGKVQRALEEMLLEEVALRGTLDEYAAFLQDMERIALLLENELERFDIRNELGADIRRTRRITSSIIKGIQIAQDVVDTFGKTTEVVTEVAREGVPDNVGLSNDIFGSVKAAFLSAQKTTKLSVDVFSFASRQAITALETIRDERIVELQRKQNRGDKLAEFEGILIEWEATSGNDGPLRARIGAHLQNLEGQRQAYFTALSEGFRLLDEREAFNKILAAKAQTNRYQDMMLRLSRNEAMTKYQSAFHHAARYAWLAARAYDYETSLDRGDSAAPHQLLDEIVRERQLGLWSDSRPQAGQGGLAEILSQLNGNFQVLKGQLGINSPQAEVEKISLRSELFRIGNETNASADRWQDVLKARIEPDLTQMPEFLRHCRPFSTNEEGPQPGIIIRFRSEINNGVNFFGNALAPGDHAYSTANFSTKVRGFGVWMENYNAAGLSTTPRAYLVPVGNDYLRTSSSPEPEVRMWSVQEQRIPTPFVLNESNLTSPDYIPTLNGVDGGFSELRRHGDFRMYHDAGGTVDESELILDSRLIGRSVWNSEWLLIIPGAGLHPDPDIGLQRLAETVTDIKLHFQTYSHQGQ